MTVPAFGRCGSPPGRSRQRCWTSAFAQIQRPFTRFAGPWSAKAEYMFARYESQNYFTGIAPPGVGFGMDVHTVKAGINYRFNWGGPVVAKY